MGGKFLSNTIGTTTNYYYVGPVSRKMYKLNNSLEAYKLFLSIDAATPWADISKIPDGQI